MIDTSPSVRLTGLKCPAAVDRYFASSLVDVAYIASMGDSTVDVFLEGVDVRKREDRNWITSILRQALSDCGEPNASIEFLSEVT